MLCERGGRRKEEGKEEERGRRTSEAVQKKTRTPHNNVGNNGKQGKQNKHKHVRNAEDIIEKQ